MSDVQNSSDERIKVELFDPPMCCAGGLCGPAIDPALLRVSEAVLKLRKERGIIVQRYLLQQQGQKFTENRKVKELLQEHGTDILPVTVVDGDVVKTGAFPSYDELADRVAAAEASLT